MGSLAYGAISRASKFGVAIFVTTSLAQAETVTIAALGDSLTAGYGLAQSEGFVPQLEGWLQAQGADIVVLNAGVSGDTTAGGLSRAAWTLTPDVDAMIIALGGNDFLRGLDPAVSKANLDGILAAGKDAGVAMLLVGLSVGANYGLEYKEEFEGMYRDLSTNTIFRFILILHRDCGLPPACKKECQNSCRPMGFIPIQKVSRLLLRQWDRLCWI